MSDPASRVAQLKQEGNTHFAQKEYGLAVAKYSEAIALDEKNAILLANRAACYLNLKQYLEASDDAEKAIQIDPKYAKAHARLTTAYDVRNAPMGPERQILARRSLLPPRLKPLQSRTAAERQYQKALQNSKAELNKDPVLLDHNPLLDKKVKGQMPWDLGFALMLTLLSSEGVRSSAWLICNARQEFERGLAIMDEGAIKPGPTGVPMFHGRTGALEALTNEIMKEGKIVTGLNGVSLFQGRVGALEGLSNGVLRDSTAFTIEGHPNWISKYNQQMQLEISQNRSWVNGRPEDIFKEAPIRQKTEGWDSVRRAVTTTVRAWIMRTMLEDGIFKRKEIALEIIGWAIEVLEWGIQTWKDVPQKQKGAIFDLLFLIGVKNFYAETMMEASIPHALPAGLKSPYYTLECLYEEAEAISLINPIRPQNAHRNPGMISAFIIYPRVNALAIYFARVAAKESDAIVRSELYKQAYQNYIVAADGLPEDEENHVCVIVLRSFSFVFLSHVLVPRDRCADHLLPSLANIGYLRIALDHMGNTGALLRDFLKILERIRLARPKVNKIWKNSSLASKGRDKVLDKLEGQKKEWKEAVQTNPSKLDNWAVLVQANK
ncbi:hypothetical protein AX16_005730 [Volvariella volvacea WC 439]|nr:hypothetical protein AX16_005730 [Volvariella volvacea WC 439]